jgi:hypothetical protein
MIDFLSILANRPARYWAIKSKDRHASAWAVAIFRLHTELDLTDLLKGSTIARSSRPSALPRDLLPVSSACAW